MAVKATVQSRIRPEPLIIVAKMVQLVITAMSYSPDSLDNPGQVTSELQKQGRDVKSTSHESRDAAPENRQKRES